ncbi:hypothetical protein Syun_022361 [Stephania yunnanensis]|uniref:Protein kinase domain-containing protein n=1 Tax=Stephania yunnanensis TaxID=152371 RepID=A0AAP0I2T8_9MAGN
MASCFKAIKKELSSKRNDFFLENNRLLLKELVSSIHGKYNLIRVFSEEEILEATNKYDSDQFLGYISVHTWYKGCCGDRDVLIKKFLDWPDRKHCATEIAGLSQIKHKNVVELLGCCLETEFPILVFKNCFDGTLSHRIHIGTTSTCLEDPVFPWEEKLRIASEIAHAVAYLHSFTVRPIIHNDITAENIILDGQGGAKLANFSRCIPLPLGRTDVETPILLGTHCCLAPEYISKGRVSEKTDVFSFGILLFELLQCNAHSTNATLEFAFKKVIERVIVMQFKKCIELANICTSDKDSERPTMKEVTEELWRIKKMRHNSKSNVTRLQAL